jgi:hypothetical protein
MSLITQIRTRRLEDIINQGLRQNYVGTVGAVTDSLIQDGVAERTLCVTGIMLSTDSATDVLVTIGFKTGSSPSVPFFETFIKSGGAVAYPYPTGDERYSSPGQSLVITTTGGTVAFTIPTRVIGEKVALGYIEYPGAPAHKAPWLPSQSGAARGQTEV